MKFKIIGLFLLLLFISSCQSEREWCLENEVFFENYSCVLGGMIIAAEGTTPAKEQVLSNACLLYAIKIAKCEAKSDCSLAHLAGCSFTFK